MSGSDYETVHETIRRNDWDGIVKLTPILDKDEEARQIAIGSAATKGHLTLIHFLLRRYPHLLLSKDDSPTRHALNYNRIQAAQVLYRFGYAIDEVGIRELLFGSKNLQFIDWAMKKCKTPLDSCFIEWLHTIFDMDDIYMSFWGINQEVYRFLIYRSYLSRYIDTKTFEDMEKVLGNDFEAFPRELIHEISEYLFLCSPSSQ